MRKGWQRVIKPYVDASTEALPKLPIDVMQWIQQARPIIDGKTQQFLTGPYWPDVYYDNTKRKMIVGGRQLWKSSYTTNMAAFKSTAFPFKEIMYITHDDISRAAWTRQRFQIGTFEQNKVLKPFMRHSLGNVGVGEFSLKNGSVVYAATDYGEYGKAEGKSLWHVFLDEAQYQDIQHYVKLIQPLRVNKGSLEILGIGGESGSPYEQLWEQTDQRHWFYDKQNWREGLEYNSEGLIIGEYLIDLLHGRWIPQKPENSLFHGYWMPQTISPEIPLTIDDAINKYKMDPIYSIEYQQLHMSKAYISAHIMGTFYKSSRRPITSEMVLACMKPYRNMHMLTPEEIAEIKYKWGDQCKIVMGVDWGSGNPSRTVITIWIEYNLSPHKTIIQVASVYKRDPENQMDQSRWVGELFKRAKCDIGVGDLGYGANQMKFIQDGGYDRLNGKFFEGVGAEIFIGCRTKDDFVRPLEEHAQSTDEHGDIRPKISIDKVASIDNFVDLLETNITDDTHPYYPGKRVPKLMIPYPIGEEWKIEWIVKDLTALTRQDIDKLTTTEDDQAEDKRRTAKKIYNHPKDVLMAFVYAQIALQIKPGINYFSV